MDAQQSFLGKFFSWRGEVGRGFYVVAGLVLFALKWNIDRLLGHHFFSISWMPYSYLLPGMDLPTALKDRQALLLMLAGTALPFIYVGVVLTVKRLRSLQVPRFLVGFFFVPFINLLFFAVLSVLPAKSRDRETDAGAEEVPPPNLLAHIVPRHPAAAFFFAAFAAVLPNFLLLWLSIYLFKEYGWGVFVGLPFVVGMLSALLTGVHSKSGWGMCLGVAAFSSFAFGSMCLVLAMEGLICLAMAMPLAVPMSILGGVAAYFIQAAYHANRVPPVLLLGLLLLMGAESADDREPVTFPVTSTIEIDAPPEVVWRHVVSFHELPPVEDWLFKAGLAYPVRAEIHGSGVGAVRHCVFSTGPFVEPITVWDEPRRLQFGVTKMPAPMEEWTFYDHVHPPHLDGYFRTTQGEFRLERLPNGRTRLHGTTWYHNDLWPAHYWKQWSDHLIHRIHLRVLKHVKHLAENGE